MNAVLWILGLAVWVGIIYGVSRLCAGLPL